MNFYKLISLSAGSLSQCQVSLMETFWSFENKYHEKAKIAVDF